MLKHSHLKKLSLVAALGLLMIVHTLLRGITPQGGGSSRVVAVCLWAENVPETAEFYGALLGLNESASAHGDRLSLILDGAVLFILKGKPRAAESDEPFPLFALSVDDLDEAASFLRDRGIKMPYGIEGSGRHRELQFYDPAGNLVELVQQNQRPGVDSREVGKILNRGIVFAP